MAECKNEMHRVIITNGIVVSGGKEQKSDILIENGRIVKTAQDIMLGSLLRRAESELLDAEGCYVFPGFIDSFTQVGGETCIEGQQEILKAQQKQHLQAEPPPSSIALYKKKEKVYKTHSIHSTQARCTKAAAITVFI